jgi:DNA-binding IscR family transcriptional regulator
MLKLSKKADYALIAVRHLATHGVEQSHSAADIAEVYGISPQLLAKVLQRLAKHGLSRHGMVRVEDISSPGIPKIFRLLK